MFKLFIKMYNFQGNLPSQSKYDIQIVVEIFIRLQNEIYIENKLMSFFLKIFHKMWKNS